MLKREYPERGSQQRLSSRNSPRSQGSGETVMAEDVAMIVESKHPASEDVHMATDSPAQDEVKMHLKESSTLSAKMAQLPEDPLPPHESHVKLVAESLLGRGGQASVYLGH